MSGETEEQVSGWTTDTLHVHVQRQINDLKTLLDERYATQTRTMESAFVAAEKAVSTALASAEKAVNKSERAYDNRFEAVNEFRGQLADQSQRLVTRVEVNAKFDASAERMETASLRFTQQIQEINKRLDRMQGSSAGKGAMYGWIVAALGLVISVVVMMNVVYGG